jgi:hypothetical protein
VFEGGARKFLYKFNEEWGAADVSIEKRTEFSILFTTEFS